MFETQNGWTRDEMIKHIEDNFKGKSVDVDSNQCLYRGSYGKKCAVGLFMPDRKYRIIMEGERAESLMSSYPELMFDMPLSAHGMNEFQYKHDHSDPNHTLEIMIKWIKNNVKDGER